MAEDEGHKTGSFWVINSCLSVMTGSIRDDIASLRVALWERENGQKWNKREREVIMKSLHACSVQPWMFSISDW